MTYNRPIQAMEALRSILSQSNQAFNLIVSDNSSDFRFKDVFHNAMSADPRFASVKYIKREIVYSAIDHWNKCLSEISSDYFCLFHDDDLMLENFVNDFWVAQNKFPQAIAFGCNAILRTLGESDKNYYKSTKSYVRIIDPKELFTKYFSRHQLGVAPFPSYIYKHKNLGDLKFDFSVGGKYCDVTWLLELCKFGEIIWINKLMMVYYMHAENYGVTESRLDRLSFLAYIKKNKNIFGRGLLSDYRFFLYKKNLPGILSVDSQKKRGLTIHWYIKKYRVRRWLRMDHQWHLMKKIYTKLFLR